MTLGPGGAFKLWYDGDLDEVVAMCPRCDQPIQFTGVAAEPSIDDAFAAAMRHISSAHRADVA